MTYRVGFVLTKFKLPIVYNFTHILLFFLSFNKIDFIFIIENTFLFYIIRNLS